MADDSSTPGVVLVSGCAAPVDSHVGSLLLETFGTIGHASTIAMLHTAAGTHSEDHGDRGCVFVVDAKTASLCLAAAAVAMAPTPSLEATPATDACRALSAGASVLAYADTGVGVLRMLEAGFVSASIAAAPSRLKDLVLARLHAADRRGPAQPPDAALPLVLTAAVVAPTTSAEAVNAVVDSLCEAGVSRTKGRHTSILDTSLGLELAPVGTMLVAVLTSLRDAEEVLRQWADAPGHVTERIPLLLVPTALDLATSTPVGQLLTAGLGDVDVCTLPWDAHMHASGCDLGWAPILIHRLSSFSARLRLRRKVDAFRAVATRRASSAAVPADGDDNATAESVSFSINAPKAESQVGTVEIQSMNGSSTDAVDGCNVEIAELQERVAQVTQSLTVCKKQLAHQRQVCSRLLWKHLRAAKFQNIPQMDRKLLRKESDTRIGEYKFGQYLGRGSFGTVRTAHHSKSGQKVAIKVIKKSLVTDARHLEQIDVEIKCLTMLSHPHIVKLVKVMHTRDKLYVVQDYLSNGDLRAALRNESPIPEPTVGKWFAQILVAVDHCHTRSICHRDITPANILLDDDRSAHLADFGLAFRTTPGTPLTMYCGSKGFIAPEVILGEYNGLAADMWSLGCVLLSLICGEETIHSIGLGWTGGLSPDTIEGFEEIVKAARARDELSSGLSRMGDQRGPIAELLAQLLTVNPSKRITSAAALRHPWIQHHLGVLGMTGANTTPHRSSSHRRRRVNSARPVKTALSGGNRSSRARRGRRSTIGRSATDDRDATFDGGEPTSGGGGGKVDARKSASRAMVGRTHAGHVPIRSWRQSKGSSMDDASDVDSEVGDTDLGSGYGGAARRPSRGRVSRYSAAGSVDSRGTHDEHGAASSVASYSSLNDSQAGSAYGSRSGAASGSGFMVQFDSNHLSNASLASLDGSGVHSQARLQTLSPSIPGVGVHSSGHPSLGVRATHSGSSISSAPSVRPSLSSGASGSVANVHRRTGANGFTTSLPTKQPPAFRPVTVGSSLRTPTRVAGGNVTIGRSAGEAKVMSSITMSSLVIGGSSQSHVGVRASHSAPVRAGPFPKSASVTDLSSSATVARNLRPVTADPSRSTATATPQLRTLRSLDAVDNASRGRGSIPSRPTHAMARVTTSPTSRRTRVPRKFPSS